MLRATPLTPRRWASGKFEYGQGFVESFGVFDPASRSRHVAKTAFVDRRGRTVAAAGLVAAHRPLTVISWLVLGPRAPQHLLSIVREGRRALFLSTNVCRVIRAGVLEGADHQIFAERVLALLGFEHDGTETPLSDGEVMRWFEFRAPGASRALH